MLIFTLACRKKYEFPIWKTIIATALLTVCGTVGAAVMFYIESGAWGGISFFGSVFSVPVLFIPISLVLRLPYGKLMDLCAVGECAMLILMKAKCFVEKCCYGIVLFRADDGLEFRFPSQLAEMIYGIILLIIFIIMLKKMKHIGQIYGYYLLIYGIGRFVLNSFRGNLNSFIWIIPHGHFWSLISIILGVVWIIIVKKHSNDKDLCENLN